MNKKLWIILVALAVATFAPPRASAQGLAVMPQDAAVNDVDACIPRSFCVAAFGAPIRCNERVFPCGGRDIGWGTLSSRLTNRGSMGYMNTELCAKNAFGEPVCFVGIADGFIPQLLRIATFCINPRICP